MVTHQISPTIKKLMHSPNPNKIIQITFAIGCLPKSVLTSVPKGQMQSLANLKHCKPKGIPIMVIQNISPTKKYPIAENSPVNINHKMFPIVFIFSSFFSVYHIIESRFCQCFFNAVLPYLILRNFLWLNLLTFCFLSGIFNSNKGFYVRQKA